MLHQPDDFRSALELAKAEVRNTSQPAPETMKERAARLTAELLDALEASDNTELIKRLGRRDWGDFQRLPFKCKHWKTKGPLVDLPIGTMRHFELPTEGWELLEELVLQRAFWLIEDERTRHRQDPERSAGYATEQLALVIWTQALLGQRSEPKNGKSVLVMQGVDWFDELRTHLVAAIFSPSTPLEKALAAVPYEVALCAQAHPTAEFWINPKHVAANADSTAEELIRREEATALANTL